LSNHFSICLSINIYLSCYFVLTNTVFLNTTSGPRKLPEYFIFASQGNFKLFYSDKLKEKPCIGTCEGNIEELVDGMMDGFCVGRVFPE